MLVLKLANLYIRISKKNYIIYPFLRKSEEYTILLIVNLVLINKY
jgi:hypothetical protein